MQNHEELVYNNQVGRIRRSLDRIWRILDEDLQIWNIKVTIVPDRHNQHRRSY